MWGVRKCAVTFFDVGHSLPEEGSPKTLGWNKHRRSREAPETQKTHKAFSEGYSNSRLGRGDSPIWLSCLQVHNVRNQAVGRKLLLTLSFHYWLTILINLPSIREIWSYFCQTSACACMFTAMICHRTNSTTTAENKLFLKPKLI